MTREEAIATLQEKYDYCKSFYDLAAYPEISYPGTAKYMQALQVALTALRGPTREKVEKMRGEWVDENKNPVPWDECNSKCPSHSAYCSECGEWLTASDEYPVTGLYCPNCGARMDKEADHEVS